VSQENRDLWKTKEKQMKNQYIEEEITFRELANRLGIDDLDTPSEYDIREEGYQILSYDEQSGKEVWQNLEAYVVKKNASEHYQLNTLHGTADHRVLFGKEYVRLEDHPGAELVKQTIQVVDCQVANTHNYIAEGQINHNTTTSGGMAIPYSSSVRIRLDGGSPIKDKDDNIIGINATAKTIKNKVGKPFRKVGFRIMFGKGIYEDEEIFDTVREFCTNHKNGITVKNEIVNVEGTGAWKSFTVMNAETGEVVHEVKFHKPEFGTKVLNVPEYKKYADAIMDSVYIMNHDEINHPSFAGIAEGENVGPQD
jgi:hypothetical protein